MSRLLLIRLKPRSAEPTVHLASKGQLQEIFNQDLESQVVDCGKVLWLTKEQQKNVLYLSLDNRWTLERFVMSEYLDDIYRSKPIFHKYKHLIPHWYL